MTWLLTLDALGTALGLLYLWLEYRASIWLWLVSLMMYGIDLWLFPSPSSSTAGHAGGGNGNATKDASHTSRPA